MSHFESLAPETRMQIYKKCNDFYDLLNLMWAYPQFKHEIINTFHHLSKSQKIFLDIVNHLKAESYSPRIISCHMHDLDALYRDSRYDVDKFYAWLRKRKMTDKEKTWLNAVFYPILKSLKQTH
jgi:hypothetical protein